MRQNDARISINAAGGRAWCSGLDGSRWYITRVSLMGLACWTPTGERSWAHEVGAVGVVLVKGDTSSHVLICPRGEKAGVETSICTVGIASIYVFMINTLGLAIWHPSMRITSTASISQCFMTKHYKNIEERDTLLFTILFNKKHKYHTA